MQLKEEPVTNGNEGIDWTFEIKKEILHLRDFCQEEYFHRMDTNPSDQFDLSHGQNSAFPNSPDNHNKTTTSANQVETNSQVMLDPNDLQNCLYVLRGSETFIGEIGQMRNTASSSKYFPE